MSLVRDPDPLPVSGLVGPETLADPQERLRKLLLAGARENQRRGAARGAAPTGYAPPSVLTLVVKINSTTKHVQGYEGTLMDYAGEIDTTRGEAMQAEFNRVLEAKGKKCAHSTPKQVLKHMAQSQLLFSEWKTIFDAGMRAATRSESAPSGDERRLELDLGILQTALH